MWTDYVHTLYTTNTWSWPIKPIRVVRTRCAFRTSTYTCLLDTDGLCYLDEILLYIQSTATSLPAHLSFLPWNCICSLLSHALNLALCFHHFGFRSILWLATRLFSLSWARILQSFLIRKLLAEGPKNSLFLSFSLVQNFRQCLLIRSMTKCCCLTNPRVQSRTKLLAWQWLNIKCINYFV